MNKSITTPAVIASLSATITLLLAQRAPTGQALLTLPMTAWILYQFRSPEKIWNSLGAFQNPILFAINTYFLTFTYLTWKTIPQGKANNLATGTFLIGGATSLLITKYWNIGG